jgi:uncharacterized repeat protein (TIGR01451 family)
MTGNTVTCDLGTLEPKDAVTVTVAGTVPAGECPAFTNQAVASIERSEVEFESNVVTTIVTGCENPQPGLTISKVADDDTVNAGNRIGFTITVTSSGKATATNVTLVDALPTGSGISWTIDGGTGAGSCSIEGSALSCGFGDMAPGSSSTVHIGSDTASNLCGRVPNSATASASNISPVTDGDSVTLGCPAPSHPGIQILKSGPDVAHVGDEVTYTFVVTNTGDVSLTNVGIQDPICDAGTLAGPGGDLNGDGTLSPGESWSYRCTHVITKDDPDPLPNTATVCSDGPSGVDVCDSDGHVIDVIHPAIEVVKEADPTSGSPGDSITYTYTVTNTGDVPLTDVSVDDDILGHVCDVPLLNLGDTLECTAVSVIPADASVKITNVVVAVGTDPTGVDVRDDDTATIDVIAGATITPPPPSTKTPPGGLAFTGSATLIPLSALALILLVIGSGLTWAGRRRGREAEE